MTELTEKPIESISPENNIPKESISSEDDAPKSGDLESVDSSHIYLGQDAYNEYIKQAYELTEGGVNVEEVDNFLDRSIKLLDKVKEPASREAIWLRVSEVFGSVAMEALTSSLEEYTRLKRHLEQYTDEQKFFLMKCLVLSQNSPSKVEWERQHEDNPGSLLAAEAWLISILS